MSNKALSAGSMWLFSHDEKSFIVHGSSDRMVKHSILDSYVLNPEAEIKGGMVLMDFEKSFPMSFDSYINGLCEGIDKITVTIPSDYVDRTVDIRPYKEGLCSLRKTGRYLTIEIHGEYIPNDCNLKEHVIKVLRYLALTARIFQQPVKRVLFDEHKALGIVSTKKATEFHESDISMSEETFIKLLYSKLRLKCLEFYTDSERRLSENLNPAMFFMKQGTRTLYTHDSKRFGTSPKLRYRSTLCFYDKKSQLEEVKNQKIPNKILERCEIRMQAGQYAVIGNIDILDTDYYGLVDRTFPYVRNRLKRYGYEESFIALVKSLPHNAYALRRFLPFPEYLLK